MNSLVALVVLIWIVEALPDMLLWPVRALMRVAPMVQSLLVERVLRVDDVIVLHVLRHGGRGADRVQVLEVEGVVMALLHLGLIHRLACLLLLLILIHRARNCPHAGLCRLLLSHILLLIGEMFLMLLLYLRIVEGVIGARTVHGLALGVLAVLAVHGAVLLREVLGMRFDQLPRSLHHLAGLERLVVMCGLLRSLNLLASV